MAYTEKHCSVCGAVNWDSLQGKHHNVHSIRKPGKPVKVEDCDTNGEEHQWDAHGHQIK